MNKVIYPILFSENQQSNEYERFSVYKDLSKHLETGLDKAKSSKKLYITRLMKYLLLFAFFLYFSTFSDQPSLFLLMLCLCSFICMVRCVYFVSMIVVDIPNEINAIKACQCDISKIIDHNSKQ